MRKNIFYFLTAIALGASGISASAQNASVSTVPGGELSFTLPSGSVSYLSLPLTNNDAFVGTVTAVTTSTVSVGNSPAPFTSSLATAAAPYFVKFLTGSEMGRVMLVTANTASSLTLDTADGLAGTPTYLTTSGFSVQVGDTFEVFPGDTLATVFGSGTSADPLVLTGAYSAHSSDTVSLYTTSTATVATYYFNTSSGYWEQYGSTANANNTVIYPYSGFSVQLRQNHPATTLVIGGRVAPVATLTKVVSNGTIYTSSHYATNITLSELQFGSNWVTGNSAMVADTVGIWNSSTGMVGVYYQLPNSTWRKYPSNGTDESNFVITPGTVMTITKRETVAGASSFLQSAMPYSLD